MYDPISDQTMQLNPAAAAIFELCDGHRTTEIMAKELALSLSQEPEDLIGDIDSAVGQLLTMGVLEPAKRAAN